MVLPLILLGPAWSMGSLGKAFHVQSGRHEEADPCGEKSCSQATEAALAS